MVAFRRCVVSLLLVLCIALTTCIPPVYASPSDSFVDGVARGAGQAAGAAAVGGLACLGTALIAPTLVAPVCVAASEVVFGWFGLRLIGKSWVTAAGKVLSGK